MRVRVIPGQGEVLVLETVNLRNIRIEQHSGQGARLAGELQLGLLNVVFVQMEVSEGMHELARLITADLRRHHQQQGIAGNVERHAEEEITAALVELQAQAVLLALLLCGNYTELEETMAGRQRHAVHLRHIPGGNEVTTAPRVVLEPIDELGNLVNATAIAIRPFTPLTTVHGAQITVFVCPFIPNGHAVLLQVADIGATFQEPEQLVDDGAQVQLFRGEAGEAFAEVEARLPPEHADGARAGAVIATDTVRQHIIQQVKVLFHTGLQGKSLANLQCILLSTLRDGEVQIAVKDAAGNIDNGGRNARATGQRAQITTLSTEPGDE